MSGDTKFFIKMFLEKFAFRVFFVSLQPQNRIGVWCNGNTTDSGPVIPGSNPGTPTAKRKICFQAYLPLFYLAEIMRLFS